MNRAVSIISMALLLACSDEKTSGQPESGFDFSRFSESFKKASLPYELSDTALLNHKDTTTLQNEEFLAMIPDSMETKVFGAASKIKYTPLAVLSRKDAETYFIVRGTRGQKKVALLLAFNNDNSIGAVLPFLVPDADARTTQSSSIDRAYSINRAVIRKMPDDVLAEGKDVFAYNASGKQFDLIMTDILDDRNLELINPIDTLPRTHKFSGDYTQNKKNLVSVRDGRKPGLLTVFLHISQDNESCTGELKGDAEITGATTAVYRQAGDPCVVQLNFKNASVTVSEVEGCGAKRGRECSFNGTFNRKKEGSLKDSPQKKKNKGNT